MTHWPLPLAAIVVVGLGALLPPLGLLLFRGRVPPERVEGHNEVAGWMFATVALLYSVTVAFVVFAAYGRFTDASDSVTREAAATVSAFREASDFPEPARSTAQATLRAYVKEVTDNEWKSHGTIRVHTTRDALSPVFTAFAGFKPTTEDQRDQRNGAMDTLRDLEKQRHLRHLAGEASLPSGFWALMIGGGVVTVLMTYLFVTRRLWVHMALVGMLGGVIAGVIVLIFSLNYPFTGQTHVSRGPFKHAELEFAVLDVGPQDFVGAPSVGATTLSTKTVTVDGKTQWTDTGIDVQVGQVVTINATGEVFASESLSTGPNGVPERPDLASANLIVSGNHAALIGRIGDAGAPFAVGSDFSSGRLPPGRLFLGVNDKGLENNHGAFSAAIRVSR